MTIFAFPRARRLDDAMSDDAFVRSVRLKARAIGCTQAQALMVGARAEGLMSARLQNGLPMHSRAQVRDCAEAFARSLASPPT